jgi:hypothetical protein
MAMLGFLNLHAQKTETRDTNDSLNITDDKGLKQGTWREYFAEGTLAHETVYKDGKKNGLELSFFRLPNCIKEEIQYRNDTIDGYRIAYYRDCKIKLVETFKNGLVDGSVRKYARDGRLLAEGTYNGGVLVGEMKEYGKDEQEKKKPVVKAKGKRDIDLGGYVNDNIPILDSAILKSISNMPQTGRTIIVTDVTGSMYSYVGQLLLWYKLTFDRDEAHEFVFFNDGNGCSDMLKPIGNTGGIYMCSPSKLSELQKTMEDAINNGDGGDMQENDLEAVLAGIKKFRNVDQVILIADRMSPVRDYVLLSKIKVPVHVILCGDPSYTNPQYLDIAWKTHGKVYTLNEQIKDVHGIREGEKLHIAKMTYVFHSGRFRRVQEEN